MGGYAETIWSQAGVSGSLTEPGDRETESWRKEKDGVGGIGKSEDKGVRS